MINVNSSVDGKLAFQPIATAQFVREFTIADLLMKSGRVVRATWKARGRMTAWWPESGQVHKKPIGLYQPRAWRVVAHGAGTDR